MTSLADGSYIVSVPSPGSYLPAVTAGDRPSRTRRVQVGREPLVYDVELAEDEMDAVN